MTGDAVVERVDHHRWLRTRRSWWSLLRIALVLLWAGWAALSWWTAPREADVTQARADLAAGRMAWLQWADTWTNENGWHWANAPDLRSSGEAGPLFVWRTPDWRTHYVVVDEAPGASSGITPGDDAVDGATYSGPEAASLARAISDRGLEIRWAGFHPQPPPTGLAGALVALALAVLVFGPAPARGTRWYWFWLGSIVPFGLGLLYWLARERPWSATAREPASEAGRDRRSRWYVGIMFGIGTGIVGSLLVYWLHQALGEWFVPRQVG